jgi:hypothetical protein
MADILLGGRTSEVEILDKSLLGSCGFYHNEKRVLRSSMLSIAVMINN